MQEKRELPGLNVQWPISQEILSGAKIIETRTYPLPPKYENAELAIIETSGVRGKFKARIVGIIIFECSFKYPSKKSFYADYSRHRVDPKSPWAWRSGNPKWGWKIKSVTKLSQIIPFEGKKGIIFSKYCRF